MDGRRDLRHGAHRRPRRGVDDGQQRRLAHAGDTLVVEAGLLIDAVEDSVSVYASAAQAQTEYAALASSKTTGCMNSVASSALQENMQKEAGSTTTVGV